MQPARLESDSAFLAEFTRLALSGMQSAEMAAALGISRCTVYTVAQRIGLVVRRRKGWAPEKTPPPPGVKARADAEILRFLRIRDHAASLATSDPGYPAAHRARREAEKDIRPLLDVAGVVVDGRRVSVDCIGDVCVALFRPATKHGAGPRMLRVTAVDRSAAVGGSAR